MPKSFNQKIKILYLLDIFKNKTRKGCPISIKDIQSDLLKFGISVERKTLYDDIETLKVYGLDIKYQRHKPTGFYLNTRDFTVEEIQVLCDYVARAKYLTTNESNNLIYRLKSLVGDSLKKGICVISEEKNTYFNIFESMEIINRAILDKAKISFLYMKWNKKGQLLPKHEGKVYIVSPIKLVLNEEYYYLVAYEEKTSIVKHYRLDKINNVKVLKDKQELPDNLKEGQITSVIQKTFSMFGGEEEILRINWDNDLINVVMDKFGKDLRIYGTEKDRFTTLIPVVVSKPFFGWLSTFGNRAEIISPKYVREDYIKFLKEILDSY